MTSKSTFSNSTSKSYALALYELAKESSELDTAEVGMRALKDLLNDSSDFKKAIQSPVIKKEEKRNIMFAIADQNSFSSIFANSSIIPLLCIVGNLFTSFRVGNNVLTNRSQKERPDLFGRDL